MILAAVPAVADARTVRDSVIDDANAFVSQVDGAPGPHPPTRREIASVVREIDVDRDATPDFELDFDRLRNKGWCGSSGCLLIVWRGLPRGGAARVFQANVLAHRWIGGRRHRVLLAAFHRHSSATCADGVAWQRFAISRDREKLAEMRQRTCETNVLDITRLTN